MKKLLVIMLFLFFGGVSLAEDPFMSHLSDKKKVLEDVERYKEYRNPTKIHIGMNREEVIRAWGNPIDHSRSETQYSLTEVWTYGSSNYIGPRTGSRTTRMVYLTFVNDKLVRITHP